MKEEYLVEELGSQVHNLKKKKHPCKQLKEVRSLLKGRSDGRARVGNPLVIP